MMSWVNIPHRYCMSRKNTNSAERIKPTPKLNTIRHPTGYTSSKNFQVNGMPSIATKVKKISSVKPKLISDDTFWDSRNRYFGTFTLVKIPALPTREFIPRLVASVK